MKKQKNSTKNISCDEALKRVFGYIDEHLQGKSRKELEHHLETCRHCFDRVEFEKLLKSRLRNLAVEAEPEALRKKIEALVDAF
ncbi:MAG: zf-HC2 domain-containing protein [Ignavibacteriales bacterium]|nr:zf-HC2 domain-containing protein [Ignavibacteriales bacterium]